MVWHGAGPVAGPQFGPCGAQPPCAAPHRASKKQADTVRQHGHPAQAPGPAALDRLVGAGAVFCRLGGLRDFSRRLARVRSSILVTTNQWPPWAFIAATAAVLWVLYRREFHSEVLGALRDGLAP